MKRRARIGRPWAIALLCAAGATPAVGSAHWEGFEAADPSTPAAVLRFDGAVSRYAALNTGPVPWRARFAGDANAPGTGDNAHAGHSDAAQRPPATAGQ
ncbi:MAG: hypothetical protein OXF98_00410 [Rhodospirillaceae bacterium]|nr:hypothetical protein [Rhodospirillaceae bacterium]